MGSSAWLTSPYPITEQIDGFATLASGLSIGSDFFTGMLIWLLYSHPSFLKEHEASFQQVRSRVRSFLSTLSSAKTNRTFMITGLLRWATLVLY